MQTLEYEDQMMLQKTLSLSSYYSLVGGNGQIMTTLGHLGTQIGIIGISMFILHKLGFKWE